MIGKTKNRKGESNEKHFGLIIEALERCSFGGGSVGPGSTRANERTGQCRRTLRRCLSTVYSGPREDHKPRSYVRCRFFHGDHAHADQGKCSAAVRPRNGS